MPPMRKKKRRTTKFFGSKMTWAVLLAAAICVGAIVAFSLLGGGDYQPISYIPPEQVTPGAEGPGGHPAGQPSGDVGAANYQPQEFPRLPAVDSPLPAQLSPEEKAARLEAKYIKTFAAMEKFYRHELNRLVESARADYRAVKSGVRDISLSQLAGEYIRAAWNLEKEADRNFNTVLGSLKEELRANNLPVDLARQAEREYKQHKTQQRKELLSKAAKYVHD